MGEIRRAPAVQRQARQRCKARARARNWKEKPAFGVRIWKRHGGEEEVEKR